MRAQRTAVAILPVRLDSQRLPGKALLAETGTPLFVHTHRQVLAAGCFDRIVVATDDAAVADCAKENGIAQLPAMRSSGLAELEGLEQLRLLENGVDLPVLLASGDPRGIETRADYDRFVARCESNRPATAPDS